MKTEINFQSSTRFEMSVGIVLLTISIIILIYAFNALELLLAPYSLVMLIVVILLFIFSILYFCLGLVLIKKGYNRLKEVESWEKKFKFEHMFNQILDQDLKLMDMKIKELEYNEKVRSLQEKGFKVTEVEHRDLKNVVEQALDTEFYERTYPGIVKNIPKRQENNKKIDFLDKEAKYNEITEAWAAFSEYAKRNTFIKSSIIRFPELMLLSFAFTLSAVAIQKLNINWIYYLVMFFLSIILTFALAIYDYIFYNIIKDKE